MKNSSSGIQKPSPRIAIAHDYLTQRGGAERVVLALHKIFPEAPIHTLLYEPESTFPQFQDAEIFTSSINKFRAIRKNHRAALPALPFASRAMKIDADIVIASSSGWAHAFPTSGTKIVYCHNPARWLYQSDEYLGKPWWRSPKGVALELFSPALRSWDKAAAHSADKYLANSSVVAKRIKDQYGLVAPVVFPAHLVDQSEEEPPAADVLQFLENDEYFLVVSRLLPYKNVDAVIRAFNNSGRKLVVVGDGPAKESLLNMAGTTVRIVSNISDANLGWLFNHCKMLIAISQEDLGLTPLEASAWGRPTVALRAGGYLDTISDGINGVFVDAIDSPSLNSGIDRAIQMDWNSRVISEYSKRFSIESFQNSLLWEIGIDLEAKTEDK